MFLDSYFIYIYTDVFVLGIEVLYSKGFRDITAIDISSTCIAQMSNKHTEYPGVDFLVLDARDMSVFPDNSFTLVFDKGLLKFCNRCSQIYS